MNNSNRIKSFTKTANALNDFRVKACRLLICNNLLTLFFKPGYYKHNQNTKSHQTTTKISASAAYLLKKINKRCQLILLCFYDQAQTA